MSEIRELLSACSVGTRLKLTGPLIVARDIAHAKIKERLDAGGEMPRYMKDHAVYYAGPAKTPDGMASGSFGPTTAGRMDSYVDAFQAAGGSTMMLAKGNRSAHVTRTRKKHGGFYLGSIGGPSAILAQNNIKKVDVLEFSELGMEAIWKIEVEDFPAFVIGTTRATTSSRSGRPEGTRVRVTLVAKLFLGYRLRTTREANKSPSDVSRCASAAGIADLGVSSPAASSKREDARVICPPHPQVEDLRDDRAVVADGGGESRVGGLHRGALGLVHVPHGGLILGLWSRLKRPSARDVKEVRQERVVGEDGWVEDDADRLGVAVTVAHAVVRGRGGVPARVSHPSLSRRPPVGFYCDGMTSSFGCWGRTGTQVLDTLQMSYESLSSTDHRGRDIGILLAMVAALKLGYIFILTKKVSATDSPQKPAKVSPTPKRVE